MSSGIARLFTQTASVATKTGNGPSGPNYGTAADKLGFLNDGHQLVRDATGAEVVSSSRWYTYLADIDDYKPGSVVTVNGRTAHVITVFRRDSAGPANVHHTEVHLT